MSNNIQRIIYKIAVNDRIGIANKLEAIRYLSDDNEKKPWIDRHSESVMFLFSWDRTAQGGSFWGTIYDQLKYAP